MKKGISAFVLVSLLLALAAIALTSVSKNMEMDFEPDFEDD